MMSFCEFVDGRLTALVISNSCSAHFLKRRSPLLLHFPTPSDLITPSQVWWSVPTLALKSPKRMSLSVRVLQKSQNQDHHSNCL